MLGSKKAMSTMSSSRTEASAQQSGQDKANTSNKSIFTDYAISTRSDDQIALTGVSVDIRSTP